MREVSAISDSSCSAYPSGSARYLAFGRAPSGFAASAVLASLISSFEMIGTAPENQPSSYPAHASTAASTSEAGTTTAQAAHGAALRMCSRSSGLIPLK